MLKLWGRNNSINVQKVLWALDELALPYDRVDAGMQFGVVNEPAYRKLNPNGRVPTIEDGGFVLWESNAIVRYLAAKHGAGTLWPESLERRADADRWMDWATTTVAPAITPVFWQLIRTAPDKRDAAAVAAGTAQCTELFGMLDARLAAQPFLAGSQFTMGDIPVGAFVHRWLALPVQRPAHPALAAYYARLKERPAYRQHIVTPLS